MPSSAVRTFTDPDEYAAAIQAGTVQLTVTGSGDFSAILTRIALQRLWMQRFSDNLPRICDVTNLADGRIFAMFRTKPGPSLLLSGIEIVPSAILRVGQDRDFYHLSSGLAEFATMSLPIEDFASIGEVMSGQYLTKPCDPVSITPSAAAMAKLARLHAAAACLAEDAPEIIAHLEAAHGLEQALIEAMVFCLGHREDRDSSAAQGQHAIVMRRFRRIVEENPERPLYIPEICKAIRVSSRTLQDCCHEHLGMGPKRYLVLRRMHLARRALHRAALGEASVTDIATRFGFWQLGRFAVTYQSLFGEAPSATLRRQPD